MTRTPRVHLVALFAPSHRCTAYRTAALLHCDAVPQVQAIMVETTTFAHMRPFSPAALACLPTRGSDGAWVADGEGAPGSVVGPPRRDLRDLLIFSVDPPGCQDIDDALSARCSQPPSCMALLLSVWGGGLVLFAWG